MRFPDSPFMKRTFDLARNRGLNVKLIPYIMQMVEPTPNTLLYYNFSRVHNQAPSVVPDPFNVSSYVADPDLRTPEGVSKRVSEVIQPFRDYFRHVEGQTTDIAASMNLLFQETNQFSMRSYMFQNQMTGKAINWCETLDKSTGWYDRALTESTSLGHLTRLLLITIAVTTAVIESLAFNWPSTPLPGPEEKKNPNDGWFCFEYVSSVHNTMHIFLMHFISQRRIFNAPSGDVRFPPKEGTGCDAVQQSRHCYFP